MDRSGPMHSALAFPAAPAWANQLISVGVTGTNGKTSTARLLSHALRALGRPVLSVTTVGAFLDDESWGGVDTHETFVGVVDRARRLGCRFAVLETTSESLAMGFAGAWPMRAGVFTNLSHDHLDRHKTAEHYLASKAQLFLNLPPGGVAVLNARDPVAPLLREVVPGHATITHYAVGTAPSPGGGVDVLATDLSISWERSLARVVAKWEGGDIELSLSVSMIGSIYVENALAALGAAVALGAQPQLAVAHIAATPPVEGRFEVIARSPSVVVDYAHTPDALERTLATAKGLSRGRVIVVFGAGGQRDTTKREPMGQAARAADCVILTSDNPRSEDPRAIARDIAAGLKDHVDVRFELDRARAIELAVTMARDDDVVLVAGKGHERTQTSGDRVRPFSDQEAVLRALGLRGAGA